MKNKILNINKDLVKRKKFLKNEIKKIILKSVIQNLNTKPSTRALALKKLSFFKLESSISKQNNNICLKSGRNKGVIRLTELSRHQIKKYGTLGCLQNIKIQAW